MMMRNLIRALLILIVALILVAGNVLAADNITDREALLAANKIKYQTTLEGEVWYDYARAMWTIGDFEFTDYGIVWWTASDLDSDGRLTSADQYIHDLEHQNLTDTLKDRPEYDRVYYWCQGGSNQNASMTVLDLSGLWLTRPYETIGDNEYIMALATVESIRWTKMQINKLLDDPSIIIPENEMNKLRTYIEQMTLCHDLMVFSLITNFEAVHGSDPEIDYTMIPFDLNGYKNNIAKWVMLYGTPEQKAVEPAYIPPVITDAPESVEPLNPLQEAMRSQLITAND